MSDRRDDSFYVVKPDMVFGTPITHTHIEGSRRLAHAQATVNRMNLVFRGYAPEAQIVVEFVGGPAHGRRMLYPLCTTWPITIDLAGEIYLLSSGDEVSLLACYRWVKRTGVPTLGPITCSPLRGNG